MADAERRRLERAAAGGDPRAEADLLRARLRAGTLDRERLSLAAHLGHTPAAEALDEPQRSEEPDLREWLWSLLPWGHQVVLRGLLVACEELLLQSEDDPELDPPPELLLDGLRAWCDGEPAADPARVEEDALDALSQAGPEAPSLLLLSLRSAARAARASAEGASDKALLHQVQLAQIPLREGLGAGGVREAVRAGLLIWSLRR